MLEEAREEVASLLRASARDILFTSGATEANNLAILGLARAARRVDGKPLRLVSSKAEHAAALAPLRLLQQEGHPLQLVDLDRKARVDVAAIRAQMKGDDPCLVVLQWANNETGVVQDLEALVPGLDGSALWHCDAVQGIGKLPLPESLWRATTLALSGHKFAAPRGIGVLRIAEQAMLDPIQVGGGQQRGLRSGTEAPAAAASFAHALRLALQEQEAYAAHARRCCAAFLEEIISTGCRFEKNHSFGEDSLPNTLHLHFPGIDGRLLLPACDADGLEASAGAACSAGAAMPSPVLLAAGFSPEAARACLRLSFGPGLPLEQAQEAAKRLGKLLHRIYEVANR